MGNAQRTAGKPRQAKAVVQPITREQLEERFYESAAAIGLDTSVISSGPLNAQVAIIGEGLGESEITDGYPFAGGSGRLLFDNLRKYGLHRANCYVTNVVKRQVSLSRSGNERHQVHRDELEHWISLLHWELDQLPNLRVVFLLGNYALEGVTQNGGILNWRGSVIPAKVGQSNGRLVTAVASINPAYAMREPKMEPMFAMDCHKLHLVEGGTFKPYEIETIINPTAPQARSYIRDLRKAKKPISWDIEFINQETACIGLTNNAHFGFCINWRDETRNRFTTREDIQILLDLQGMFDDPALSFIAQNGKFDTYWVRLHDWLAARVDFDTLLAHHTLYPQLPHSLAFQVAQYTTHPYYKDEGRNWKEGGDIDQYWRYNCKDAALTLRVAEKEKIELEKQGLSKFFNDHVMRAHPHTVSATVHGVAVDLEMKKSVTHTVSEDVAKRKAEWHKIVQELTDDEDYFPNPDSWQQLQVLFFDKLGLKGRGRSTDEANRIKMITNAETPPLAKEMLTLLNRYKEENKFLGTYAESRVGKDGRFRCEYNQAGTTKAPGRLSSKELLDGQGGNMQNQPPRARAMYIADPGMVFGYFDLKQAEAQVVAVRANIETWMEQFIRMRTDPTYDAHRALASEMFKIPYDKVPVFDFDPKTGLYTIRYVSKRCKHGLNYRMQPYTLSEVTGLPYHESRKAYALYHAATPEIQQWWKQEDAQFRKTRVIYNALGRRWKVIQRLDEDVLASVIAFYPQSTIGDKITQVWYQAEEDDKWPMDARVCIDVHDNLVALASHKTVKTALRVLKGYAESPIPIIDAWGKKTTPWSIQAECKISFPDESGLHRWSNMKAVEL